MIADFSMRIAEAAAMPAEVPLVFSVRPTDEADPSPLFWQVLGHFGVARERVMLVRTPTLFTRLYGGVQAERLHGPGPSRAHLDRMDAVVASGGSVEQDIDHLFVSRSGYPDARLLGEAYLDHALERAGVAVMHPERLSIADQIELYRRARTIIFSEGSAVHGLQLLGRIRANVVVIERRSGRRLGRRFLLPRVGSLQYWDVARGRLYGRNIRGRRQIERSLICFDEGALVRRFDDIGVNLDGIWDQAAYEMHRDADLRRWIAYAKAQCLHPLSIGTIQRNLEAQRLSIAVADVVPLGAEDRFLNDRPSSSIVYDASTWCDDVRLYGWTLPMPARWFWRLTGIRHIRARYYVRVARDQRSVSTTWNENFTDRRLAWQMYAVRRGWC